MDLVDEQGDTDMEDPQAQDDEEVGIIDDAPIPSPLSEADADPVVSKKRKAGKALEEILDMADLLKAWGGPPRQHLPTRTRRRSLGQNFSSHARCGGSRL